MPYPSLKDRHYMRYKRLEEIKTKEHVRTFFQGLKVTFEGMKIEPITLNLEVREKQV